MTKKSIELPSICFGILALPEGIGGGFITVTVAYCLAQHGVGVDAIAGIVALNTLAGSGKFLFSPILDLSLNARLWFLICLVIMIAAISGITLTPLDKENTELIWILCLILCGGMTLSRSAAALIVAQTSRLEDRGSVSGWFGAAQLGGTGIGGGLGLWLFEHAGGLATACSALIVTLCLCALPVFFVKLPRVIHAETIVSRFIIIGPTLVNFFKSREAILLGIITVAPMGVGSALFLLPAVANDWEASADLVAVITGVAAGIASALGSLIAGNLTRFMALRTLYLWLAGLSGLAEFAMAVLPHSPLWFGVMTLFNMTLLGGAWAVVGGFCLQSMRGYGASTIFGVMASLSNVPVYLGTIAFGMIQVKFGSTAMLASEGILGLVTLALLLVLLVLWPESRPSPEKL